MVILNKKEINHTKSSIFCYKLIPFFPKFPKFSKVPKNGGDFINKMKGDPKQCLVCKKHFKNLGSCSDTKSGVMFSKG